MKLLLLLIVCFASTHGFFSPRIVNGTDAQPGEIPYIVSCRRFTIHNCGGSILNERNVLTAAHCFTPNQAYISIQYGIVDISNDDYNGISVASVIPHEEYDGTFPHHNDVSILKLANNIPLGNLAQPVVLPRQGEQPIDNSPSLLAGWGNLGTGEYPTRLQKVTLKVYSHEDCANAHGSVISYVSHLCSGVEEGWKGQCSADSGGPLVSGGKQIGVVSWSKKPCAIVGYPGVYAKVCSYTDWIRGKMAL